MKYGSCSIPRLLYWIAALSQAQSRNYVKEVLRTRFSARVDQVTVGLDDPEALVQQK